jgi:hypothetical protein
VRGRRGLAIPIPHARTLPSASRPFASPGHSPIIPGTLDAGTLNAPALAIVVIVGCLVNSLADNTLLNSPTGYVAALILAAVLALPGIEVRRAPTLQTV